MYAKKSVSLHAKLYDYNRIVKKSFKIYVYEIQCFEF